MVEITSFMSYNDFYVTKDVTRSKSGTVLGILMEFLVIRLKILHLLLQDTPTYSIQRMLYSILLLLLPD